MSACSTIGCSVVLYDTCILCVGGADALSIVKPPNDTTIQYGATATFSCQTSPDVGDIIYLVDGVVANSLAHRGIFQTGIVFTNSYAMSYLTVYGSDTNNGVKIICKVLVKFDVVTLTSIYEEAPLPPAQLTVIKGMWRWLLLVCMCVCSSVYVCVL